MQLFTICKDLALESSCPSTFSKILGNNNVKKIFKQLYSIKRLNLVQTRKSWVLHSFKCLTS